jgi:hypothetical protein
MYLFAWVVFGAPIGAYATGLAVVPLATVIATMGFAVLMAA